MCLLGKIEYEEARTLVQHQHEGICGRAGVTRARGIRPGNRPAMRSNIVIRGKRNGFRSNTSTGAGSQVC